MKNTCLVRLLRLGAVIGLLSLIAIGCGGDVSGPAQAEPPLADAQEARTYELIFPFKDPATVDETFVFEHNDVVTYMNWVRSKDAADFVSTMTAAFVHGDFSGIPEMVESSTGLAPYVPREDQLIYKAAHPELSDETFVPAEPVFYQADGSQNLIPIATVGFAGIILEPATEAAENSGTVNVSAQPASAAGTEGSIPPLLIDSSDLPLDTQGRLTNQGGLVEGSGLKVTITGPDGPVVSGQTYDFVVTLEPGDPWTSDAGDFGDPTTILGLGVSQLLLLYDADGVTVGDPTLDLDGTTIAEA